METTWWLSHSLAVSPSLAGNLSPGRKAPHQMYNPLEKRCRENLPWSAYEIPALHREQPSPHRDGWCRWIAVSGTQQPPVLQQPPKCGAKAGTKRSQTGKHYIHKANNMILQNILKKKKEKKKDFQWTFHRSQPCYQQKAKLSATADFTSSPLPPREPSTSLLLLPFLSFNPSVPLFL